jgi:hypothetical protein
VTHKIVVAGYQRLHDAAFMEGDSLLALTSEQAGEVLIVLVADGAIRRTLSTGGRASHMLALGRDWIYAANITDGTVSQMDPNSETAPNVRDAGTRTEGIAATPDGTEAWTGSMDGGYVVGLEGASGRIVARVEGLKCTNSDLGWPAGRGKRPRSRYAGLDRSCGGRGRGKRGLERRGCGSRAWRGRFSAGVCLISRRSVGVCFCEGNRSGCGDSSRVSPCRELPRVWGRPRRDRVQSRRMTPHVWFCFMRCPKWRRPVWSDRFR